MQSHKPATTTSVRLNLLPVYTFHLLPNPTPAKNPNPVHQSVTDKANNKVQNQPKQIRCEEISPLGFFEEFK